VKGVVLGGTASGVGKTVATLAVIEALQRAGHDVQPAEAGLRRNYARGEGDVCVVEGVMGLYDGDTDGLLVGRTLGAYYHAHVNSGVFDALVESARDAGV